MPKAPPPAVTVDLPRARAFWFQQQGLATPGGSPHAIVRETGWVRTLGGVDAYLALWSRSTGLTRAAVDEALASGALRVSPAARGCIYLVAREDLGLAMRLAEGLWRPRAQKDVTRAGGTWKEVDAVATAVLEAVAKRSLTTDEIRAALPAGTVRSYGSTGKAVGLSSPLPVALRQLEFEGKLERMVATGRLDTERYVWRRPKGKPFGGSKAPSDPAACTGAIVDRFLRSAGPATVKDLAAWAGISQTEAKAGLAHIGAVPVMVEGYGPSFVRPGDERALAEVSPTTKGWSLLSFEDNYTTLHGGPGGLTDPAHHGVSVTSWGRAGTTTLGEAKHLASRAILWGSELVGLWEHDPDASTVVTGLLGSASPGPKTELAKRAKEIGRFIAEELGHARSFSLDTDDALRKRTAAVAVLARAAERKAAKTKPAATKTKPAATKAKPAATKAKPAAKTKRSRRA